MCVPIIKLDEALKERKHNLAGIKAVLASSLLAATFAESSEQ